MPLPPDIIERSERVYAYHQGSKHSYNSVRQNVAGLDWANQPSVYRVFENQPKVPLPTTLLDAPTPTVALLRDGLDGLPESQHNPPQNLKTLASWLYLTYGLTQKRQVGAKIHWLRPTLSAGWAYPCEIYVAAFAVDDLEPGLYHFSPRTFALYKLRDGAATLYQLKRGRPDLEFLKTIPAALLVSTIFARSTWRYRQRGYRYALLDAGHLIENLAVTGTGLGIQTLTRLRLNDSTTRELIGVEAEADYGSAEAVQGMVVWADRAEKPMDLPASPPSGGMSPIPRPPLAGHVAEYPVIVETHRECLSPGLGRVEMRPPITEISPIPGSHPCMELPTEDIEGGLPLRELLLKRQPAEDFTRLTLSRTAFAWLNQLAFRRGTYFPIHPDGAHVGLIRPYWLVSDVTGLDNGSYYYNVKTDRWCTVTMGEVRFEAGYLSVEQEQFGRAAAVCFMTANLPLLLTHAGPDAYRLAHLEAGIAGQRLYLASTALGLGYAAVGAFYDDEVKAYLGLQKSGWEVVAEAAIGGVPELDTQAALGIKEESDWRG